MINNGDLVVDFFETAAVSYHHLGCHVGVVLFNHYGVVQFVLSILRYYAQLDLLFVAHFLLLARVTVAEPTVDWTVGWQGHLFCVNLAVLGAVDGRKLHGRACFYCFFEINRYYVIQFHPFYFRQLSVSLENHLVSHISDHRIRPHEALTNSTQQTYAPFVKILIFVELKNFILHPRTDEVLRETSDAIGKVRYIRVVWFVIKMKCFGCIFNDNWLAEFEESDINLKVKNPPKMQMQSVSGTCRQVQPLLGMMLWQAQLEGYIWRALPGQDLEARKMRLVILGEQVVCVNWHMSASAQSQSTGQKRRMFQLFQKWLNLVKRSQGFSLNGSPLWSRNQNSCNFTLASYIVSIFSSTTPQKLRNTGSRWCTK